MLVAAEREAAIVEASGDEARAQLHGRFQYYSLSILLVMHHLDVQLPCFFHQPPKSN